MGRFKKLPVVERVTIVDIGAEGNAIGRVDDMVVFAPMVIPGDVVDIQLKRKRKKFAEGVVIKIHEYSPDRIKPACIHFGVCGGCKWQHLPYDKQLYYKQKQVKDNLERIGKVDIREVRTQADLVMRTCGAMTSNRLAMTWGPNSLAAAPNMPSVGKFV